MASYTVKKGDTVWNIARGIVGGDESKIKSMVNTIATNSKLSDPSNINVGQNLWIPDSNTSSTSSNATAKSTNSPTSTGNATSTPSNTSTGNPANESSNPLMGVSSNTSSNLNKYQAGYTAGDSVTNAQAYLQSIIDNKPGDFTSDYSDTMNSIYDQIMNRDKFSYDLNGDMLYQQYKDQYSNLGKLAMQDTMGQASALTGGYGNSYASTAGNQAYQNYLGQLNNVVPELYGMALDQYNNEGENLYNNYSLAKNGYDTDYAQYQDKISQYNNDRNYAQSAYQDAYSNDYGNWQTMLNYWQNQASAENGDYWNKTNYDESVRQYNENLAYQKAQDAISQSNWEKEYANSQKQAAAAASTYSGLSASEITALSNAGDNEKLAAILDGWTGSKIDENTADALYSAYMKKSNTPSVGATPKASLITPVTASNLLDMRFGISRK